MAKTSKAPKSKAAKPVKGKKRSTEASRARDRRK